MSALVVQGIAYIVTDTAALTSMSVLWVDMAVIRLAQTLLEATLALVNWVTE